MPPKFGILVTDDPDYGLPKKRKSKDDKETELEEVEASRQARKKAKVITNEGTMATEKRNLTSSTE